MSSAAEVNDHVDPLIIAALSALKTHFKQARSRYNGIPVNNIVFMNKNIYRRQSTLRAFGHHTKLAHYAWHGMAQYKLWHLQDTLIKRKALRGALV